MINTRFNTFLASGLVAAVATLSAGCQSSSDSSGGSAKPVNNAFVGIWVLDASSYSGSSDPDYKDNFESDTSSGYLAYVVDSNFTVNWEMQGTMNPSGGLNEKRSVYRGNRLVGRSENSVTLQYGNETLDQARAEGASEEVIKEAQAHPCTFTLVSDSVLEMKCNGDSGSKLNKVTSSEFEKIQSTAADYIKRYSTVRASLDKALASTKWQLLQRESITSYNGKEYPSVTPADQIPDEETSTDMDNKKVTYPNVKSISFGSGFAAVSINGKSGFIGEIQLVKNSVSAKLRFGMKMTETTTRMLSESGVVSLSKDLQTLTLTSSSTYKGNLSSTIYTYKRVK